MVRINKPPAVWGEQAVVGMWEGGTAVKDYLLVA